MQQGNFRAIMRGAINAAGGLLAIAALWAGLSAPARASVVTVHAAPFLIAPTNHNGFEAMAGGAEHSEQGIAVAYVGRATDIWSTSQAATGSRSWYPNGGGFGYTEVTLAQTVSAFQFAAGSGWLVGDPGLQFRLLLSGTIVAEGVIDGLPRFSGFQTFGFSGIAFDEVHLQSLADKASFNAGGFDALALDDLVFGGQIGAPPGAIPEPKSWAMMILGFGLAGASLRRRSPISLVT